jgi:hypothetical protein
MWDDFLTVAGFRFYNVIAALSLGTQPNTSTHQQRRCFPFQQRLIFQWQSRHWVPWTLYSISQPTYGPSFIVFQGCCDTKPHWQRSSSCPNKQGYSSTNRTRKHFLSDWTCTEKLETSSYSTEPKWGEYVRQPRIRNTHSEYPQQRWRIP